MFSFARTKHDYVKPLTSISNELLGKRQSDVLQEKMGFGIKQPFQ